MVNTNEVYRKIKEMSKRTANPRPNIQIQAIASEMMFGSDQIESSLKELKDLRLIQFDNPAAAANVKLTLLGCTVTR